MRTISRQTGQSGISGIMRRSRKVDTDQRGGYLGTNGPVYCRVESEHVDCIERGIWAGYMFRRFVATFALVGYIAGQSAAVPHAHAGAMEAPGHTVIPHVHLSRLSAQATAHGHSHGKHDHGHRHHTHQRPSPVPVKTVDGGDNHDADAFYLPDVLGLTSPSDRASDESLKCPLAYEPAPTAAASLVSAADLSQLCGWQSPPESSAPHCALFLELRTLRI